MPSTPLYNSQRNFFSPSGVEGILTLKGNLAPAKEICVHVAALFFFLSAANWKKEGKRDNGEGKEATIV